MYQIHSPVARVTWDKPPSLSLPHHIRAVPVTPDSDRVRAHGAPEQGGQYLWNMAGPGESPWSVVLWADAAQPNERMECRPADDSHFWDSMARKVYSKTPRKATCRVGIFKNCYIVDFFCASGDACTTTARLLILLAGTNVPLSRTANAAN